MDLHVSLAGALSRTWRTSQQTKLSPRSPSDKLIFRSSRPRVRLLVPPYLLLLGYLYRHHTNQTLLNVVMPPHAVRHPVRDEGSGTMAARIAIRGDIASRLASIRLVNICYPGFLRSYPARRGGIIAPAVPCPSLRLKL